MLFRCSLRAAVISILAAGCAVAQEAGNPWTDVEALAERMKSGNTRLAEAAVVRFRNRSLVWTDAELARLAELGRDADEQAGALIRTALEKVVDTRTKVAGLSPPGRRLATIALSNSDCCTRVVLAARAMNRFGELPAADLDVLVELLPPVGIRRPGRQKPREGTRWSRAESDRLASTLRSRDDTRLAYAIYALGVNGAVEHASELRPLLRDERAWVRWQAAVALDRMGQEVPVKPLLEVLPRLSAEVGADLVGLCSIHGPEDVFENPLAIDCSGHVTRRIAALVALSRSRSPKARELVFAQLRASFPVVSFTARDSALAFDGEAVLPLLIPRITDNRPLSREHAAWLMGEMQVDGSQDLLGQCLEDTFPRVRAEAVLALGKLRAEGWDDDVARRLKDSDESVRAAAARALAGWQITRYLPEVTLLLDDPVADVRLAAAEALSTVARAELRDRIRQSAIGRSGTPLPLETLGLLGAPFDVRVLSGMEPEIGNCSDYDACAALARVPTEEACLALIGAPQLEVRDTQAALVMALLGRREEAWMTGVCGWHAGGPRSLMALSLLVRPRGADPLAFVVQQGFGDPEVDSQRSDRARRAAALVRAGFGSIGDCRFLLREIQALENEWALRGYLSWYDFDEIEITVIELALEGFAARIEPATVESWMRPFRLSDAIFDAESLTSAFADAGLKLERARRATIRGRIPAGLQVTPRWLAWRCGLRTCILTNGTVQPVTAKRALGWWKDRLEKEK